MKNQHTKIILEKISTISNATTVAEWQIENTIKLLEAKDTVPFISRYRKEVTGGLDEVQIADIKNNLEKLIEIDKRREAIINSLNKQGNLTDKLKNKLENTYDLTNLEDIYLPYKPKRKTKASIAKEKGLEPLADIIIKQQNIDVNSTAKKFVKGKVADVNEALQGARDIMAEWVNENQRARNVLRNIYRRDAIICSKIIKDKETEGIKYKDYFDFTESLKKSASHRLLAMRRGEEEGFLKISIIPSEDIAVEELEKVFVPYSKRNANNESVEQVQLAIKDGYKRLLQPSIETEFSKLSKEKADEEAIKVFASNLYQLLMSAPLGQKRVLAIDPGYRSGCKVVCIDAQGNLLHNEAIFPHKPQQQTKQASRKVLSLISSYKIDAIAIGNGTAGRETESFIQNTLKFDKHVSVFIVNESGASIYSASPIAREEFPEYDVTVRGAVSIGRRLMDPLAELVKLDPKSIGVGQYQHDVDQTKLKNSLDQTVENCVNAVGVNLNTASKHLLTYVSGLGPQLAQNIVDYRKENGAFKARKELKKVSRMGAKGFEQCAGFLRITEAKNPLDNSAVHPESYHIVTKIAKDLNTSVLNLIKQKELRTKINLQNYISEKTGLPTLKDIIKELAKPGLDPRKKIKAFEFDKNIRTIEDLKEGIVIRGIVTNITNFGAFVDIGVKQDGLVHISNLREEYTANPTDVVSLNQQVEVEVINVDINRKRIQLSMKKV